MRPLENRARRIFRARLAHVESLPLKATRSTVSRARRLARGTRKPMPVYSQRRPSRLQVPAVGECALCFGKRVRRRDRCSIIPWLVKRILTSIIQKI